MNNMVLGIEEYLDEEDRNKKLDFIQFKKYFQRIYKKTGCRYEHWIEDIEKSHIPMGNRELQNYTDNIYIYGHSLDITDKDVLKELILLEKTQISIYYRDEDDFAQKISNLVKLVGQGYLIDKVYGSHPKIKFKKITI